ncbi:MAG: hypothetical protein NC308_02850 [Clostridium sp.]|nr:rRNA cytosine-C5-methyltransferase [Bacteroides sp.]MCM1197803.1 hypothetical protein [Clostridium sp.]
MVDGFREYLEEAIGREHAAVAFSAFNEPASVSVRRNPFKCPSGAPSWDAAQTEHVPWSESGTFILSGRPVFTLDPLFHAGAYYVQDSSSMFVGEVVRDAVGRLLPDGMPSDRPFRILDLCAAPGGKTTDLASSMRKMCGGGFLLVANEVMKQRAGVLADNLAIWGEPNVLVTSADPSAFASLGGYFDLILADVPCSGEGMFRKDGDAVAQWSRDNVALCQARQRRIIADVWPSLAEGGILVYSTCTFNRYENDLNVGWIMQELGAEPVPGLMDGLSDAYASCGVLRTEYGYSLVPGLVKGEGQYCACMCKTSEAGRTFMDRKNSGKKRNGNEKKNTGLQGHSLGQLCRTGVELRQKGNLLIALPADVASEMESLAAELHPLRAGCAVGEVKGKDLVPSADLALSLLFNAEAFPMAELTHDEALSFLHRDSIVLPDVPKGYAAVCYGGLPLGFVKNLGNRCNNLHPQGRRIRMDIK